MKKEYNLLLFGFFGSVFLVDFVKYIKKTNPGIHIFFWGVKPEDMSAISQEYLDCYDEYSFFEIKPKLTIPFLRYVETIYLWRKSFKAFVNNKRFDVVNIHFTRYGYVYILDIIKKHSSKLVLTPWGSDVYRIDLKGILLQRILYHSADYITGRRDRFTKDVQSIFHVKKEKIAQLFFGSSLIEYINNNIDRISEDNAKQILGLSDSYIITCGYNALPVQNHLKIIDSIYSIKDKLPHNLLLLFPFTYGRNKEYIEDVKKRIGTLKLNAVYFEDFLDISDLFLLRQATDIFVHVQTTDADSTSLREYLLCDKRVVNGEWLRYDELEINGVAPYFLTNSLDSLGDAIFKAYSANSNIIPDSVKKYIGDKCWSTTIVEWDKFFSSIIDKTI